MLCSAKSFSFVLCSLLDLGLWIPKTSFELLPWQGASPLLWFWPVTWNPWFRHPTSSCTRRTCHWSLPKRTKHSSTRIKKVSSTQRYTTRVISILNVLVTLIASRILLNSILSSFLTVVKHKTDAVFLWTIYWKRNNFQTTVPRIQRIVKRFSGKG